jgi:hypothetical protein
VRNVEVRLDWGREQVRLGTLAEVGRRILFEYDQDFLRSPLPVSPFKLPARAGLFEDNDMSFGGLYGGKEFSRSPPKLAWIAGRPVRSSTKWRPR